MYDFVIVGAGFAGSVMAERLASQLNKKVLLIEKRSHIGGNAYDEYDENEILVHKYGPHIFHTNSKKVFNYLSKFTEWRFYEHKVLAKLDNEFYPIPINRITLNKLYNLKLKTKNDVENYLKEMRQNRKPIKNSEDIIVNQVGYDLFDKFFKHYTKKQWKLEPKQLSPLVCGRIPVRFDDDCRYFSDKFQFMPENGYTKMFERMLSHSNIEIILNTDYKSILNKINYKRMIYTGPIDYFFDYKFGKLPYRSVRFEFKNFKKERIQQAVVVNYVDQTEEFSRVTEYKFLTGTASKATTLSFEYSQIEGEPYYPVPTEENRKLYLLYKKESEKLKNVIFCGRLAEYQYYNMDQVVANSLNIFNSVIEDY